MSRTSDPPDTDHITSTSKEPLPYHPNSQFKVGKGYFHLLNDKQKSTLAAFQKLFPTTNPTSPLVRAYPFSSLPWHYDAILLRFLRARKFNVQNAEKMLKANIEYRLEHNVPGVSVLTDVADVLENPDVTYPDLAQYYPHGNMGFDKQGRPVTYKLWGNFEVWNLKKLTALDNLTKFHIWEQEHLFNDMIAWGEERGYHCETITAVIDIKGMKLRQITKDFLYLVKAMAGVDQNHYPERMGCTYIINCPSMFSFVWKGIVPWLDKETAAKIKILASEKEWRPVLDETVGNEMLPPLYGGTNKSITPVCMAKFFGIDKVSVEDQAEELKSSRTGFYDIYRFDSSVDHSPNEGGVGTAKADSDRASSDFHSALGESFSGDIEAPSDSTPSERKIICYSNFCSKLACCRPCFSRSGELHLVSHLQNWPLKQLCVYTDVSNAILCFMSISMIVFMGAFINSKIWTENSDSVDFILWMFIVTIVLAAIMLMVAFDGILAVHYQNVPLLKFHSRSLFVLSVFLLLVATVSLVYSAKVDDWLASRIGASIEDSVVQTFRGWHFIISGASFAAAFLCLIPGILGSALRKRFTNIINNASKRGITDVFYRSNMQRIRQLRVVLRCTNGISLCFALSCVSFGSYGVQQAIQYGLDFPVYAPFFLAEIGIVLTILSMLAFWASSSKRLEVFSAYQYLSVPFIAALVSFSIVTFVQMTSISASQIGEEYIGEGETAEGIAGKVKVTVTTSGVLEAMAAFFFTQNLLISRNLYKSLVKSQRAVTWRQHQIATEIGATLKDEELSGLSRREILASTIMFMSGLLCLFFDGTYLAFSGYVAERDGWITALWREMNKIDNRYTQNDPLVMSMVFLASFLFGPLSMVYSWALLTRKRYTHVAGIIVGTCTVLMQVVYLLTAYYAGGWTHFKFDGNYWGFRFLFFFYKVFLVQGVGMMWIVMFEVKRGIGISFEHEDVSIRLRKEDEAIDLNAAKVLFGGSSDDLTMLAEGVKGDKGGGGGELVRRRPQTPAVKGAQL